MNRALPTATHHSYYTNGVTEASVGHGPTGADEGYLSERTIVTRGPASSCAISITAIVAVANKMKVTKQSTRALTVSSRMPRRPRGCNGASAPQAVRSFPSDNETPAGTIYRRIPTCPELAKSLKSGGNDVTGGSWPHQSTTFRERHVTLSIGYGYLKRENEKKPNLEERAAAPPHELKTLRCPIQRGKDVIDDAMRGLTDGQQQLERIR